MYDAARNRPAPAPTPEPARQQPTAEESEASRDIATFCQRKWGTDYSMQKYCQKKQTGSLLALAPYSDLPNGDERRNIVGRCVVKWTEGDISDWAMVEYCTKKQVGAFEGLR